MICNHEKNLTRMIGRTEKDYPRRLVSLQTCNKDFIMMIGAVLSHEKDISTIIGSHKNSFAKKFCNSAIIMDYS